MHRQPRIGIVSANIWFKKGSREPHLLRCGLWPVWPVTLAGKATHYPVRGAAPVFFAPIPSTDFELCNISPEEKKTDFLFRGCSAAAP